MKRWALGLIIFLSLYFLVSLFFAPARAGAVEATARPWLNKEILEIDVSESSPSDREGIKVRIVGYMIVRDVR